MGLCFAQYKHRGDAVDSRLYKTMKIYVKCARCVLLVNTIIYVNYGTGIQNVLCVHYTRRNVVLISLIIHGILIEEFPTENRSRARNPFRSSAFPSRSRLIGFYCTNISINPSGGIVYRFTFRATFAPDLNRAFRLHTPGQEAYTTNMATFDSLLVDRHGSIIAL